MCALAPVSRALVAAIMLVLLPGLIRAQEGLKEVSGPLPPYTGAYGGINFSLAVPTGEFDDNVNQAPGFGVNLVIPFTPSGSLGLLIQGGGLDYWSRSRRIPFPGTAGLVEVELSTGNDLWFFGAGLQYAPRHGTIRPYLNGTLGGSYLRTVSSVRGTNDTESFANTTNLSDFVFAATAGGGLYIPFGKAKKVAIDLGAQFHWGGRADYLTESGVIDNGDGTTSFNPSTSRTDFVRIQIGFEFRP